MEIYINFQTFWKNDDLHSLCVSDITECERHGFSNDLKVLFQKTLWQEAWLTVPNTAEICATTSWSYLLIPLKELRLKKSLLVVCKILGLFVNTLTADESYSLLNRDILSQRIEMQLSKKEKALCVCVSPLWKYRSNFNYFKNNDDPHRLCNYQLRKTWLLKWLKSPVSEDPSTGNMLNGPKHCWNLNNSTFIICLWYVKF